jgi:hypothetical protein
VLAIGRIGQKFDERVRRLGRGILIQHGRAIDDQHLLFRRQLACTMDLASINALRSLSVDKMSGRAAFCGTITPMAHPIAGGYYNSESRA